MFKKTFIATLTLIAVCLTGMAQVRPLFRSDTLSIRFIGDVMMHSAQLEKAKENASGKGEWDFSRWFEHIEGRLKEADVMVANMEFALAGAPYTGYPCFSAPDEYAFWAADCGIDIFLTANNHILDKGKDGAVRTLETYRKMEKSHGIRFTGLSGDAQEYNRCNPLMFNVKGFRIALLNFTYGTNNAILEQWPRVNRMSEKEEIASAVERAVKLGADLIVALPHWGEEYKLRHSAGQQQMADFLFGAGVDAIIGSHPHVVQDTTSFHRTILHRGRMQTVPVVYSLGNAISNMSATDTQLELMVTLRIARNETGDVWMLPLEMEWLWCSRPGGFCNDYTVLPVSDFLDKREHWMGKWDYDKMKSTLERVSAKTGIGQKK